MDIPSGQSPVNPNAGLPPVEQKKTSSSDKSKVFSAAQESITQEHPASAPNPLIRKKLHLERAQDESGFWQKMESNLGGKRTTPTPPPTQQPPTPPTTPHPAEVTPRQEESAPESEAVKFEASFASQNQEPLKTVQERFNQEQPEALLSEFHAMKDWSSGQPVQTHKDHFHELFALQTSYGLTQSGNPNVQMKTAKAIIESIKAEGGSALEEMKRFYASIDMATLRELPPQTRVTVELFMRELKKLR